MHQPLACGARKLRRKAAADYIQQKHGVPCSPNTLAKEASIGGGPRFVKYGRFPLYEPIDLDAYVEAKLSRKFSSTSEYGEPAPA